MIKERKQTHYANSNKRFYLRSGDQIPFSKNNVHFVFNICSIFHCILLYCMVTKN